MRSLAAALSCLLMLGCDRAPTADGLPEWKPGDHDRLANEGQQQAQARQALPQALPAGHSAGGDAGARSDASGAVMSTEELADMAWKTQCTSCHGPAGHGNGPQAPMLHPPDFSSKEWQAQHTDVELAASIVNGKNKMPKFGLPERVVAALVARVRSAAP